MFERFIVLILALTAVSNAWAAEQAGARQLAKSVLPIHLQVQFMPPPFWSDDRTVLAYELYVTNYRDLDLTLTQLEVLPAHDLAHPLATFAGEDLRQIISRPGKPEDLADPERIGGGEFAVVFLWCLLDSAQTLPQAVAHRATFLRAMPDGSQKEYVVEGASAPLDPTPPIVIRPPLPAGRWLMANGPSMLGITGSCCRSWTAGRPATSASLPTGYSWGPTGGWPVPGPPATPITTAMEPWSWRLPMRWWKRSATASRRMSRCRRSGR